MQHYYALVAKQNTMMKYTTGCSTGSMVSPIQHPVPERGYCSGNDSLNNTYSLRIGGEGKRAVVRKCKTTALA